MAKKRKINKSHNGNSNKNNKDRLYQNEILKLMKAHPNKPFSAKQVGADTGLWSELGNSKLRALMEALASKGKIEYMDKGKYQFAKGGATVMGKLEVTRSGSGYVLQEDTDDIYIPSSNMGKAMNGDLVKVKLLRKRRRANKPEGEIMEIVQRARTFFVGTVEESMPGSFFVLPDDPRLRIDFYVPKDKLNGAQDGEKVLLKLTGWERKSPEGEVVEVLGEAGVHDTEMHAILLQYGFPPKFPLEVEQEAEKIPLNIPAKEIAKRRDMREVPTFTIDPEDAKDFDDALSFQVLENGHYEVGVHIADVSHYVRPDTALDKEGFQRATSVYLVDRTVPMLPEKLSNGVCSLRPNEDKLTFSTVFEMDDNGKIHKEWIGKTVIHSDRRFTYEEAQEVIIGKAESPMKAAVITLNNIAKELQKQRFQKGSIEFETDEVKFVLDEQGKPLGVKRKVRFDAHKMIEDFMLLANRRVAAFVHGIFSNPPLPSIYRIHDRPDEEKLGKLQEFVRQFGYEVNLESVQNPSENLNYLLGQVSGKPEQHVIKTLAVRSMAKAVYTTKNVGHFGLGFPFYTHFTSPIRRYPDLLLHRILHKYQQKQFNENPVVLEEQCKHCSTKEKTAAEAERASIKYKQVEFLEDRIGKTFDGIISGIKENGFWVELEENLCEGYVAVHTLEDDYYNFDADNYSFIGREHGKVLRLGDPVEVEISGTDLKRRTVDMLLVRKREAVVR